MSLVERLYEAAANAGLLKECLRIPPDGSAPQRHWVGLAAPDDSVLENLALTTNTTMSYPAGWFPDLAAQETVTIEGQAFQVREIRAVGDGSEMRAKLARI